MLVIVVNHNCNENAIKTRNAFLPYIRVCLVDSGSALTVSQASEFDVILPNVYYSGLINHSFEIASNLSDEDVILFITSDVTISSPRKFLNRLTEAFGNPAISIWAPASFGTGHPHMRPQHSKGFRRVSFVEGFCFAIRKRIFAQLYPVDLKLNRLGWGLDVQLGYLAASRGGYSVVDDDVEVIHPQSTGYDTREASLQSARWRKSLPFIARAYWWLSGLPGLREGLGHRAVYCLIRICALFRAKFVFLNTAASRAE